MLHNRKHRKLSFQSLESRALMAGDVQVALIDGILQINGDNASNAVEVRQLNEGVFEVRGLVHGGANTTLNGATRVRTFSEVEGITAAMNGGDDRLFVIGTASAEYLERDLLVQMGTGSDRLEVRGLWVSGDGELYTDFVKQFGAGNDTLVVEDCIVYGRLDVTTGAGSDYVAFQITEEGGWNTAHLGFSLDTGWGTTSGDKLKLDHIFTWGAIDIKTSDAKDVISGSVLLAYEGSLTIETGGGDDEIYLKDCWMDWELTEYETSVLISTGEGNDTVVLTNIAVRGSVLVSTEAGMDTVKMSSVSAREWLFAQLGENDDTLFLEDCSAGFAWLAGGNQDKADTIEEQNSLFASSTRTSWEIIN
jgi:hypothetical protein